MLPLSLLFVAILALAALTRPTLAICLYLAAHTLFFGWFDAESVLLAGRAFFFPALDLVLLLAASVLFARGVRPVKGAGVLIALLLLLYAYALLMPVVRGESDLALAFVAGKGFMSYFFLVYLLLVYRDVDDLRLMNFIEWLGRYLSLVLVAYAALRLAPPAYVSDMPWHQAMRVWYPTFISLALFLSFWKRSVGLASRPVVLVWAAVHLLALYLAGHMSIFLSSIVGLTGYWFLAQRRSAALTMFAISLLIGAASAWLLLPSRIDQVGSAAQEDLAYSLSSRDRYNSFRWQAIWERPLTGYGFLHFSTDLVQSLKGQTDKNRFLRELEVIDSGYVDLLVKFGLALTAGLLGYLVYAGYYCWSRFRLLTSSRFGLCIMLFLGQMLVVNYTWSMFTFPHGILVISVGLFWLFKAVAEGVTQRTVDDNPRPAG